MPYGVFLFSNPTEMIPENNKPTTFFKFENLRIYYKAIDFADAILALADNCSSGNQTIQHFFSLKESPKSLVMYSYKGLQKPELGFFKFGTFSFNHSILLSPSSY